MEKTHPQQKGKSKIQLCYKEAAQFTKDAILVLVSSSSTQKKWSSNTPRAHLPIILHSISLQEFQTLKRGMESL